MSDIIQITVAVNTEEDAYKIAEVLVGKRFAASCWVSGPITSRYWWKGSIEKAQEWICTAKTRADLYSKVEQAIKEMHPYDVPGILAISAVTGGQNYLHWITQETEAMNPQDQTKVSKEQLIQELVDAHEKLIAAASTTYEQRTEQKEGVWGPREILAHIAAWEAMAVARTPEIMKGMPPIMYISDAQHAFMDNAVNQTAITLIGNQPFEAIRDILREAYRQDVLMLESLDETLFTTESYMYKRTRAAIDHVNDHIQALQKL